jgi:hypothetical protein
MSQQQAASASVRRTLARRTSAWVISFTLVAGSAVLPAAGDAGDSSSAPRVLDPSEEVLTSYRAFRRMHAKSQKFNQEGWLDAWTEQDATGFRYTIVSERGSEYVRNKVLRAVLQREQEIVAGGADRAALTEQNYTFSEAEPEDGLRYVLLKPKRKDVMLVEGRMVLNADSGDLLRVEGKLSKNPSFWTSLVNVIRHFAKLDGVRVPVSTNSVAKVKFAGESRLDVFYHYESINGRPVSVAARQMLASAGVDNR